MSAVPDEPGRATAPAGFVREVVALGVAALATRGELAAVELADARDRASRWLLLAVVGGVLLLAALLVGSLWVVSLFWDSHRSVAIAAVALLYALLGGGLLWWLAAQARAAPPLLRATLDELKKDCEALRGASQRPR